MIYWLLITLTCLSIVRTQYISNVEPDSLLLESDSSQDPSVSHYFNTPFPSQDRQANDGPIDNSFYRRDYRDLLEPQRKRRTIDSNDNEWNPNAVDTDKTSYVKLVEMPLEYGQEENSSGLIDSMDKKSFSPWGGKRDQKGSMWSWNRKSMKEPNILKRVRFSPWGGKRSEKRVYKTGNRSSKLILTAITPDLTHILSSYMPRTDSLDITGYHFIPSVDKSHPIELFALSTNVNERTLREALPFNKFMDSIPKMFKFGHPYSDISIKKDGKRKVKFSAWGGKRSPPIVGPVWTAASQDHKENTLNAIILLRRKQAADDGSIGIER